MLASGGGTTLQALLAAAAVPGFGADVVAVVTDQPHAGALERARAFAVPTAVVPLAPGSGPDGRRAWDAALADRIASHGPDLVVSAGFMRLLGPEVLGAFPLRILNTHPALLPAFPGTHAVRDALAYGVRVSGATLHLVDAGVDTGPVVAQVPVAVEPDDDEATLHERIKVAERRMLAEVVGRIVRAGYQVDGRKVTVL